MRGGCGFVEAPRRCAYAVRGLVLCVGLSHVLPVIQDANYHMKNTHSMTTRADSCAADKGLTPPNTLLHRKQTSIFENDSPSEMEPVFDTGMEGNRERNIELAHRKRAIRIRDIGRSKQNIENRPFSMWIYVAVRVGLIQNRGSSCRLPYSSLITSTCFFFHLYIFFYDGF